MVPRVVGSSPISHPTSKPRTSVWGFFDSSEYIVKADKSVLSLQGSGWLERLIVRMQFTSLKSQLPDFLSDFKSYKKLKTSSKTWKKGTHGVCRICFLLLVFALAYVDNLLSALNCTFFCPLLTTSLSGRASICFSIVFPLLGSCQCQPFLLSLAERVLFESAS